MAPSYDYTVNNKLSEILSDARLQPDKYGTESDKVVRISYRTPSLKPQIYQAKACLLTMLYERYGDISFGDAIKKYEGGK